MILQFLGRYIPVSAFQPPSRFSSGGSLMRRPAATFLALMLLLAAALVLSGSPQPAQAQTTPQVLVSNLTQAVDAFGNDGHDHAQAFTSGDNALGYTLTSADIFFRVVDTSIGSNQYVKVLGLGG